MPACLMSLEGKCHLTHLPTPIYISTAWPAGPCKKSSTSFQMGQPQVTFIKWLVTFCHFACQSSRKSDNGRRESKPDTDSDGRVTVDRCNSEWSTNLSSIVCSFAYMGWKHSRRHATKAKLCLVTSPTWDESQRPTCNETWGLSCSSTNMVMNAMFDMQRIPSFVLLLHLHGMKIQHSTCNETQAYPLPSLTWDEISTVDMQRNLSLVITHHFMRWKLSRRHATKLSFIFFLLTWDKNTTVDMQRNFSFATG